MIKILAFDVSSSTTGYSIFEIIDNSINLINSSYIKPIKTGNIIKDLADTRDKIKTLIGEIKPTHIVIEDIIKFMSGKSSAQTIITLTSYNRMISLLAFDYLNQPPQMFSVMAIRHGLKINKIFPKKEDMPELVANHLNIKFPYEYNNKQKIKVESYDKADAIAVGLYYAFILTNKIKQKKAKVK